MRPRAQKEAFPFPILRKMGVEKTAVTWEIPSLTKGFPCYGEAQDAAAFGSPFPFPVSRIKAF